MSDIAQNGESDRAVSSMSAGNVATGHAVHAQIAEIARAFGATIAGDGDRQDIDPATHASDELLSHLAEAISPATAAEACLIPALTAIGWGGVVRDVQEALPHFDRIRDIEGLRSVLARLNYQTRG